MELLKQNELLTSGNRLVLSNHVNLVNVTGIYSACIHFNKIGLSIEQALAIVKLSKWNLKK